LTIDEDGIGIHRYWDVDLDQELAYSDPRDYLDHFMTIFRDAVWCRVRGQERSALALSGGLDSSLIAGVLSGMEPHVGSIETVSLVFPGMDCDESTWIDTVDRELGISTRRIVWAPVSWDELLAEAARIAAIPPSPNSLIDMLARARMSRTQLLTGSGGDQWMYGSDAHFRDLVEAGRWGELARNLRLGGVMVLARRKMRSFHAHVAHIARTRFGRPRSDPQLGPSLRGLRRDPHAVLRRNEASAPSARIRRYNTLHTPWEAYTFECGDQYGSGSALPSARPFYDRRVVEFALALPDAQRWRGTDSRWFEARALATVGLDQVSKRRSKAEFSSPLIRQVEQLPINDLARSAVIERMGWIPRDSFSDQGWPGESKIERAGRLSLLVSVEAWVRGSFPGA
jgi:asparagine synthase (glutamine-hydrolysing)